MITDDLAAVLSKVRRPGDFFATGATELLAPLLEVERVGPVALPLLPIQAKELIGVADPAPYGRGEQTGACLCRCARAHLGCCATDQDSSGQRLRSASFFWWSTIDRLPRVALA